MNILITSDLHLTDNPMDEYRWEFFDFLLDQIVKYKIDHLIVAGDAWDRKDRHSGKLLNRAVSAFHKIKLNTNVEILIVRGNHDSALEGTHYWEFLNRY